MRRPLLLLAALAAPLLAAPGADAQIAITRADVEALHRTASTATTFESDSSSATRARLQGILNQFGGNQIWSFVGIPFTAQATYHYTPVTAPQPGSDDAHFAPANVIVRTDSIGATDDLGVGYYRLDDTGLTALGSAFITDDGTTQKLRQVPGLHQPLPYTYGSSWTNESRLVFDPAPLPMEQAVHEESIVVGWGVLATPWGGEPALMVRTTLISSSTITLPGLPPIVSSDTLHSVNFMTQGRMSATILIDDGFHALSASYTAVGNGTAVGDGAEPGRPLALQVGPNPARRGLVRVRLTMPAAGDASVRVYDALGREVAVLADGTLASGPQTLTWDAAAVPAGLYVVRARAGADTDVRRLVVQ
jgi:hypothetical protein